MTFIIKHKRSDRPMVAEYLCPVHGRFALTVDRDANGDPPPEMSCDFEIESCGNDTCGRASTFAISKPGFSKVKLVEAVRGGYQRPERETWTDTTNLGEGQSLEDWQDDRAKVWDRERERQVYEMTKEL